MPTLVMFDLDGTLLDTLEDLAAAHNAALVRRGLEPIPMSEYRYLVGEGLRSLNRKALLRQDAAFAQLSRDEQEEALDAHLQASVAIYRERLWVKTQPYPGIEAMLRRLAAAGIGMGVLSNKADDMTKRLIAHFFPEIDFAFVEGMSARWPRKPDPSLALHCAARGGYAPAQVVFVGDTSTDMQTARAGGFTPFGVSWGFRAADELWANGALRVADRVEALRDMILAFDAAAAADGDAP